MSIKENKNYRKLLLLFWLGVLGPGIIAVLLMYLISVGSFGPLPSFEELENPNSDLATVVYSADGKVLGKYFKENRTNVNYEDISQNVHNALIATEDERFRSHSGVDMRGLTRAVVFLGSKGGASTITQQLAKMLFHGKRDSNFIKAVLQKLKEWVISARLERQYTKDEILTMYLNKLDFVNNAVGIKSASNVYFNKEPFDLNIEEAAMLVGMAKNPSLFNPIKRPDTTLHRRNVVLSQMKKNDFISTELYDSLRALPLTLDYKIVDHKEGLAPYFREVLRAELKTLFSEKDENDEYVLKKPDGSPYNIYRDGIKIYTTIDSRMQKYAEWAMSEHLGKELQDDFFRDLKKRGKKKPFDWRLTENEIDDILTAAMKRTGRYRIMVGQECANCGRRGKYVEKEKKKGIEYFVCNADDCLHEERAVHKDSVEILFNTPVKMKVFTWKGEVDTMMSPMDSIKHYKSYLQSGLMSIDPHTGYIKAWVGGINYHHFKYDHVKQGKRQVGSTFKPFIYSLAIQEGYSPCYTMPNSKVTFEKEKWGMDADWTPKNSDGVYGCEVSLKYALANSMNTITAGLLKKFGPNAPQQVINLARRMGITSHLDPVPSLVLGVADLSLYELVGANATFANKGVWTEPIFITRIEDKNGNVIKDFIPQTREAMSEEAAYVMLDMMKGIVDGVYNECLGDKMNADRIKKGQPKSSYLYKPGTGMRIRGAKTESRPYVGIKHPMAGKTGTTQNNSDGWFMGITPDLVTGVWVGAEDRGVRFSTTHYGQGANMALPIWGYYMNKIYDDESIKISTEDFEKPIKKISIDLDCNRKRIMKEDFSEEDFDQ